jgi:hypothetical protein
MRRVRLWTGHALFAFSMLAKGVAGFRSWHQDPAKVIARDPSLGILVKDPMYQWSPAGDLKRTEKLRPWSDSQLASGSRWSRVVVEFRFRTSGDVPALQAEAEGAMLLAGYDRIQHSVQNHIAVFCTISQLLDGKGIYVMLSTMG